MTTARVIPHTSKSFGKSAGFGFKKSIFDSQKSTFTKSLKNTNALSFLVSSEAAGVEESWATVFCVVVSSDR
jgi:hypothetical protein